MEPSEHEQEKVERLRRAMYSRSLSEKLKDRPRRILNPSEPTVPENFVRHEEGDIARMVVAPRTINLARVGLWWLLGAAVAFFILAVGIFAYFFVFGGGSIAASAGNIDISVSGPQQIRSGESTELQIVVANRNKVPLELADLVITYPSGTRSPTDFVTNLPSQRISLGTIGVGEERQGTVPAVFAGTQGQQAVVKVELEYHLGGSNAVFVASSDYNVTFASSPLSIAVEGNPESVAGQPVELTVTVASNATAPVRDVLLSANYPFGFKFSSAMPAPAQGNLWQLGDLAPGQKSVVTIRGSLAGEEGDQRVFRFTSGTRGAATSTAIDTVLTDSSFPVTISKPFLGLVVSVNNATGPAVVVKPQDTVEVGIAWQNNLPTAITNAVIVARLSGLEIDGSTVHSTDGFFRSTDDTLLWDKTTTKGTFANLAPGETGTVEFSFQMPTSDALKGVVNPYLDISIDAAGSGVSEGGVSGNLQAAAHQRIALASDLELSAQGLYYANPFGSVGPLPPKAGVETTYAIVFTVTNTTNKISGAELTATLPPYVRYIGIHSPPSENLTFNESDGTVTWNLGDIAPGVGLNGTPPRQAGIAIGFTPSTSQIGQEPTLLGNISLNATDAATNAPITLGATPDVTTNLSQIAKSSSNISVGTDPGFSAVNATVVK